MISTSGLSISMGLKLIQREQESFNAAISRDLVNAREIKAFRERISSITSVDDLVKDYEVYSFVMKAHDLESQIFGKAMMKKVLSSDIDDRSSLVNKMTDTRFKELYRSMGFTEGGKANPNVTNPDWIEGMVDRYIEQKLINTQLESNEGVGVVLHAARRVDDISSWYTVLADTKLQDFFYKALGLSSTLKTSGLDTQVAALKKAFDISTINDEGVFEKLTSRYSAFASVNAAQAQLANNPVLQLLSNSNQARSINSINLAGLTALSASKYMR